MPDAAPPFSHTAADRIGRAVRWVERRMRNPRGHRGRWHKKGGGAGASMLVAFELAQALEQFSGDVVLAYRRDWDPTADFGWGAYYTTSVLIRVADSNLVGHTAGVGGMGMSLWRNCSNGKVGVIIDLCCPDEEAGVEEE